MPEEEAFCLFVRLMNHYHLRDMFVRDMPGLHLHLYQFERLLEDFEPAVYCHLHRRGVTPQLYATQWFLTLFAYRFPLQLVLRIYDLILSEGLESAILKFGLVLMQKNAAKLLEMKDMAVLTTYLKERLFDVYIDKSPSASSVLESGFFGSAGGIDKEVYKADALVQDACAVKVSSEMLKQYTGEWEEKTRDEKQKLAEEEAVRAQNQSLSFKVKTLEERSQKFDSEHVQVSSFVSISLCLTTDILAPIRSPKPSSTRSSKTKNSATTTSLYARKSPNCAALCRRSQAKSKNVYVRKPRGSCNVTWRCRTRTGI